MAECCCCPGSRHSDSCSHMINCFLVGTGTSLLWLGQGLPASPARHSCMCLRAMERMMKGKGGKTSTIKNYVLLRVFVCHWTLFLNTCCCFGIRLAVWSSLCELYWSSSTDIWQIVSLTGVAVMQMHLTMHDLLEPSGRSSSCCLKSWVHIDFS